MRADVKQWVDDAKYDLECAKVMLDSGRYFFVVFMCHLTIEKLLKAVIVERQNVVPPKIHNLVALAIRGGLTVPPEHRQIITELDDKSVQSRYPDGRQKIAAQLNAHSAADIYQKTVAFVEWLKQEMNFKT